MSLEAVLEMGVSPLSQRARVFQWTPTALAISVCVSPIRYRIRLSPTPVMGETIREGLTDCKGLWYYPR